MKTAAIILVMLLTIAIATAQEKRQSYLFAQVTQDVKLAVMEDDYGNTPFTLDISAKVGFKGFEGDIGHVKISFKYEYADLYGGIYKRWGVEGGYSFTRLPIPFTNMYYRITPMFGYGKTTRHFINPTYTEKELSSYEGTIEFGFRLNNSFNLIALCTYATRPDLEDKFGTPNFSVGGEYSFEVTKKKSRDTWRR